jgi:hypothetical protein
MKCEREAPPTILRHDFPNVQTQAVILSGRSVMSGRRV